MKDPFYNIDEIDKEQLLKQLETVTFEFPKNNTILEKIKNDNFIGIIIDGLVQIIKTDYNGNRTIIEELSENSMLFFQQRS